MGWLPKTPSRVRREAADWIAKRNGDRAHAADDHAFEDWYAESERHASAYDRLAALWELSGQVTPVRDAGRSPPDQSRSRWGGQLALAASLCALILVGAAVLLGARATVAEPEPLLLASAVGEVLPYSLPDGSALILDTQSKLRIEFSERERRISLLAGRARFVVGRDPRPFTVEIAGNELSAAQGTFDASLIGAEPLVQSLQGALEVRKAGWTGGRTVARLHAGETVVLASSGAASKTESAESGTAWPQRMLEFEAIPLDEALALANRYSRTEVRLADPALGKLTVTGAFHVGEAAALARSLAVAFALSVSRDPDGAFVLSRRRRI